MASSMEKEKILAEEKKRLNAAIKAGTGNKFWSWPVPGLIEVPKVLSSLIPTNLYAHALS